MPTGIYKRTKPRLIKKCLHCGKDFITYPCLVRDGKGKYCGGECYHVATIGRPAWNKDKVGVMPIPWNKDTKGVMKANKTSFKKGQKPTNFKGGRRIGSCGYIMIYMPSHPFCDRQGYVREHRLVMEKRIGRYLRPEERVHHLNGIKTDNRIQNLLYFSNECEHQKFHQLIKRLRQKLTASAQ